MRNILFSYKYLLKFLSKIINHTTYLINAKDLLVPKFIIPFPLLCVCVCFFFSLLELLPAILILFRD